MSGESSVVIIPSVWIILTVLIFCLKSDETRHKIIFRIEIKAYIGFHKIIDGVSIKTFAYFSVFASFRSFRPFFGEFRFIVSPFCCFDAKGMKVTEITATFSVTCMGDILVHLSTCKRLKDGRLTVKRNIQIYGLLADEKTNER